MNKKLCAIVIDNEKDDYGNILGTGSRIVSICEYPIIAEYLINKIKQNIHLHASLRVIEFELNKDYSGYT